MFDPDLVFLIEKVVEEGEKPKFWGKLQKKY